MPIHQRYQLNDVEGVRVGRFKGGVNTSFIVYRIGEALIDAGPANQWPAVRAFISERPVGKLLLTHHHEDHGGNAARIARHCGMTPFAPVLSQAKLRSGYRTPLVQRVVWGSPRPVETQPLPEFTVLDDGTRLQAIHTPGHAKDLHVFYLPDRGELFSGDLYISKSLRYLRSDERLDQLVDSIRKVLALDFTTLFCPHRGILEDGKPSLAAKLDNILALCGQAQDLHQRGQPVTQIVQELLGPEDLVARLTNYNFSKLNLITEALKVPVNA